MGRMVRIGSLQIIWTPTRLAVTVRRLLAENVDKVWRAMIAALQVVDEAFSMLVLRNAD